MVISLVHGTAVGTEVGTGLGTEVGTGLGIMDAGKAYEQAAKQQLKSKRVVEKEPAILVINSVNI